MQVKLIAITHYLGGEETPEELVEYAGRVCYRSQSQGDPARFISARLRDGHESIIEHASATFEISGISRACSHQLVRHRIASYSQESQRYVDMSDPELVIPEAIAQNPQALELWNGLIEHVKTTYAELRTLGIRKEDARFVLPNATATRIIVTMNFREFLHYVRLRITPEAQWEIRQMSIRMLELLVPHAPTIFGQVYDNLKIDHPQLFK